MPAVLWITLNRITLGFDISAFSRITCSMTEVIPSKAINARKRQAPEVWRAVFAHACSLDTYPEKGFGYADIQQIAEAHDITITYESLRVKLDRYKRSLYVKKIGRGRFQIPITGYYFFDLL